MRSGIAAWRIVTSLGVGMVIMVGMAAWKLKADRERDDRALHNRIFDQIDADKEKLRKELLGSTDAVQKKQSYDKFAASAVENFEALASTGKDEVERSCMRVTSEMLNDLRSLAGEFHSSQIALQEAKILDFDKKPSDFELDRQIALVREYEVLSKKYQAFMMGMKSNIRTRIEAIHGRTAVAQQFLAGFDRGFGKHADTVRPLCAAHVESAKTALEKLEFLKNNRSAWKIGDARNIEFYDDDLMAEFQSLDAKAQQAEQEIQIYSQRALQAK